MNNAAVGAQALFPLERASVGQVPTLNEWYEEQGPYLLLGRARSTVAAYAAAFTHRLGPVLGHLSVDLIDDELIERAYVTWKGSASTKGDAIALLRVLIRRAKKKRLIDHNPFEDVELPGNGFRDLSARALTEDEYQDLLRRITKPVYRYPVIFLKETGLRWGEMAGVWDTAIDFDNGIVNVVRSYVHEDGGMTLKPTTKGRRYRQVPLSNAALDAAANALEHSRRLGVENRVFSGPQGGVLNGKNMSRANATGFHKWRDEVRRYPKGEDPLKWHDLRHTACVRFFEDGLTAPEVQEIMGHASLEMTRHYARGPASAAYAAREKILVSRG